MALASWDFPARLAGRAGARALQCESVVLAGAVSWHGDAGKNGHDGDDNGEEVDDDDGADANDDVDDDADDDGDDADDDDDDDDDDGDDLDDRKANDGANVRHAIDGVRLSAAEVLEGILHARGGPHGVI
eukprot:1268961-Pyramimonas_sp.AAC.1